MKIKFIVLGKLFFTRALFISTLLIFAFFFLTKISSAQCNLETKALYDNNGEIAFFKKLDAWEKDLNKDGLKDTIITYQIAEKEGQVVRFPAVKGLVVLGIKDEQGNCEQVYHRFSNFITSTKIYFKNNRFCMTTTTGTGNYTQSKMNCFKYNTQNLFELDVHKR